MKRLILTLCVGVVALLVMAFAFMALTDAPIVKQEIVKEIQPAATSSTPSTTP
jgi:hypothetical protein